LWRLRGEFPDQLQFGIGKRRHGFILIEVDVVENGPLLSATRGINNTMGCVRKRRGGNRWSS
jgi:hypothetical protein